MDASARELEWYFRDHLFRQQNAGRKQFEIESLPADMVRLYLRFRGVDPGALSEGLAPVIERLVSLHVLSRAPASSLELSGSLVRLQCAKCFYISYLVTSEAKKCLRCDAAELHDFPRKK